MDTAAPDLADYLAEVRRRARLLSVAALLGGLLVVIMSVARTDSGGRIATASLSIVDVGHPLQLLLGSDKEPTVPVASIVTRLNSPALEASAIERAGVGGSGDISLSATGDQTSELVSVRVRAQDEAAARALVDATVVEISAVRRDELAEAYAPLESATRRTKQELESRLAAVDAQLSSLPGDSAVAEYAIASALQTRTELEDVSTLLLAIDEVTGSRDGGIQQIGATTVATAGTTSRLAIGGILGALLGGLVALGYVVTRRFVSAPTDVRSAVERCGVPCLAVIPEPNGNDLDEELRGVTEHLLASGPALAVTASGVREAVVRQLTDLAGPGLRIVGSASGVRPGDRVLILVDRGTREDELRALAFASRSVGVDPIGAILTGVATRDLSRARSR